jgi:hypothetical protein
MGAEPLNVMSLFLGEGAPSTTKRKDSGVSDAVSQLNSFKGFGEESTQSAKYAILTRYVLLRILIRVCSASFQTVNLTFTPSRGSTCISLYPRTKIFTFASSIDDASCVATCEDSQTWRISAVPSFPGADTKRYDFERMSSEAGETDTVKETFRSCSVAVPQHSGRQLSHDYARKLSVGHYSSGLSGFKLPFSPKS